jgi:glycosyl transferase family 4
MRELALNCMNGFLLSFALVMTMQRFASRIGLLDIPTARKKHQGHIPMVGAGLFVAIAVSALLLDQRPSGFASFMMGLAALVVLGVFDDRLNLRASVKLVAQIGCVALMVLPSQTLLWRTGGLFGGSYSLQLYWAVPLTIVAMVGLINAYNMIDGVDGLAGSLSVVALLWFAIAAGLVGLRGELLLALLVAFCVSGFLVFNLHNARSGAGVSHNCPVPTQRSRLLVTCGSAVDLRCAGHRHRQPDCPAIGFRQKPLFQRPATSSPPDAGCGTLGQSGRRHSVDRQRALRGIWRPRLVFRRIGSGAARSLRSPGRPACVV